MLILVTGGAGYIGSHTCVELLNKGYEVVVLDNLSNSSIDVLDNIKSITGKNFEFYQWDLLNIDMCREIFKKHKFDGIIHFAGKKAVGESVEKPLLYYKNNIVGTLNLLQLMEEFGVYNIVFSSSATVYGEPKTVPVTEESELFTTNPYGATKLMIENILRDVQKSNPAYSMTILRYFNPIGAHESGKIGEKPVGIPNNLLPYITKVASGQLECLNVYGNDYNTPDGTGVRDYIHVVDLSQGHIKAIEHKINVPGVHIYNLGTGQGYSVLEIVSNFEQASGKTINYKIVDRRKGDVATIYADASKAEKELGFKTQKDIKSMMEDTWRWECQRTT